MLLETHVHEVHAGDVYLMCSGRAVGHARRREPSTQAQIRTLAWTLPERRSSMPPTMPAAKIISRSIHWPPAGLPAPSRSWWPFSVDRRDQSAGHRRPGTRPAPQPTAGQCMGKAGRIARRSGDQARSPRTRPPSGRRPYNDIVIDNLPSARARRAADGGRRRLHRRLNSTNGTYINGKAIKKKAGRPQRHGRDRRQYKIRVPGRGRHRLRAHASSAKRRRATAPAAAPAAPTSGFGGTLPLVGRRCGADPRPQQRGRGGARSA